jgi:hypothetical protein
MPRPGRIYFTVDVNYFDDPDIGELSDSAQLLDLRAMALSKRIGSDGQLTRRQMQRIAPESGGDSIDEIIDSGVWIDKGDALERRNWLAWNDSAEMIEIMSRGGKRGNHEKWHVKGKKPPTAKCEWCVEEGLISPPTRPRHRPPTGEANRGSSLHRQDVDVDTYTHAEAEAEATPAAITSISSGYDLRAVAEWVEGRFATVEEARAELAGEGWDERWITTVLALAPNLRPAP